MRTLVVAIEEVVLTWWCPVCKSIQVLPMHTSVGSVQCCEKCKLETEVTEIKYADGTWVSIS